MATNRRWVVLSILFAAPALAAAQTKWPQFMPALERGVSEGSMSAVLPNDIVVETPGADVSSERAKWSGKWSGWACRSRKCDTKLVVEKVSNDGAFIIYAFASESVKPFTVRLQARFVGEELQATLEGGARVAYRMRDEGDLEFLWWKGGQSAAGVLSKVQ